MPNLVSVRPGVVKRFHLRDGALMAVQHDDGYTTASLHYYVKTKQPPRVERSSARYQSLRGALAAVLEAAGSSIPATEVESYIRTTHWGAEWPT